MKPEELSALEYFIAGVPPRAIFEMDIEGLKKLVESTTNYQESQIRGTMISEVCLIGLAAYFEAYCKNQFAAIINICPQTLETFATKRDNLTIKLKDILKISGMIDYRLGSLLAEQYDFGSARTINSLFFDLLGVTLFSRSETEKYAEFLEDRNLLVHHGGIFTLKYREKATPKSLRDRVYFDSLVIHKDDFLRWATFIHQLVNKFTVTTHKALQEFVSSNGVNLEEETSKAINFLLME
ncbi:MAG: hypothetical protein QOC96_1903 [Acidobacteriota bacterium]|jgi:hypothetical protein|nr:hypothetical protein [Acidobacteriota bacterium]